MRTRTLVVTMRPRKGGKTVVKSRRMNDRYTEESQLLKFIQEIRERAAAPLRLVDFHVRGAI